MFLTVDRRNELSQALLKSKVPLNSVKIKHTDQEYRLDHAGAGFVFLIERNPNRNRGNWDAEFNVRTNPTNGLPCSNAWGDRWSEVASAFRQWAALLQREISVTDIWAEAKAKANLWTIAEQSTDDAFSAEELLLLPEWVHSVERRLAALKIPKQAEEAIVNIAREVPNEAGFFSKKKLSEIVIGQIIGQCIKWGLTLEHMQAVLHVFQGVTHLLIG